MEWLEFGKDVYFMGGIVGVILVGFLFYFIFGNPTSKLE